MESLRRRKKEAALKIQARGEIPAILPHAFLKRRFVKKTQAQMVPNYLKDHPAPEDVNYYICGPPMMLAAVSEMLDSLGVESENIHYDDFGG